MRTFSRADWDASQAEWTAGQFSDEWRDYRHEAAMKGMIYPPTGSRHDSWDDDSPSQRAILIRAIRETPDLTHSAIERSSSWSAVIAYILARRDEWSADLDAKDREIARQRDREANPREAVLSLRAIIDRIAES
jgi:hypothetical protein